MVPRSSFVLRVEIEGATHNDFVSAKASDRNATPWLTATLSLLVLRFEVEREYVASVEVPPASEEPGDSLVAALGEGVTTADGVYKADVPGIDGRDVRVVVREGKNRMVRR